MPPMIGFQLDFGLLLLIIPTKWITNDDIGDGVGGGGGVGRWMIKVTTRGAHEISQVNGHLNGIWE